MPSLHTYLTFDGDCFDAFEYYKTVLGGEYESISRFGDMPAGEDFNPAEDEKNLIMHVSLPISDNSVLMGSDRPSSAPGEFVKGTNFSISIQTESIEDSDRIFKMLSTGGFITMPIQKTFWGSYFGMLTDKYGIQWMVNCNLQDKQ